MNTISISRESSPVNYSRGNDREFCRKTDLSERRSFEANQKRRSRVEAMAAKTAAENPRDAGDILWL